VGEIGIHLDHQIVTPCKGPLESRNIGSTQTILGRSGKEMQAGLICRSLLDPSSGPVRGSVIHDQNLDSIGEGKEAGNHLGKIFPFVIGWNDDEDAFGHGGCDKVLKTNPVLEIVESQKGASGGSPEILLMIQPQWYFPEGMPY
jgi:hypothetical protein